MMKKINKCLSVALFVCLFFIRQLQAAPCENQGENIGDLKGVVIHANGCNIRGPWQCVEFAKRFYFQYYHYNIVETYDGTMNWSGSGNIWHEQDGMISYYNRDATELPRFGDTLAFGTSNSPHVAIVSQVTRESDVDGTLTFYQQNWSSGKVQKVQYVTGSVNYHINPETGVITVNSYGSYRINGWGRAEYTVPTFSRDDVEYNVVYGFKNQPLYAKIEAINSEDYPVIFDHIGIGGKGPGGEDDIRDIIVNDNYEISGNESATISGSRTFDNAGEYQFFPYVIRNGANVLRPVADRHLIFTLLDNEKSVIIDDSETSSSRFSYNEPIGIKNTYYNTPANYNLQGTGYLYGSISVCSDSKHFARWKPQIEGEYRVAVFIPKEGASATVQYEIKPEGSDNSLVMSSHVDQSLYNNEWVWLEDENTNTTWTFSKDGYVELYADYEPGKRAGFDAVKFAFASSDSMLTSNIDTALIIDSSGSMEWNDPLNNRLEAACYFIDRAEDNDYIAVIDFDEYTYVRGTLHKVKENRDILKEAVDEIDRDGGTNIGEGLKAGYDQLISSPTNNQKIAILLTDGQSDSYHEDKSLEYMLDYSEKGWQVYTIGLSEEADEELLVQISETTGGEYFKVTTEEAARNAITKIYQQIDRTIHRAAQTIHQEELNILLGQVIERLFEVSEGTLSLTVDRLIPGSDVEMSLVQPDGTIIDRTTRSPDVYHALGATYEIYRVANPMPGMWKTRLEGTDTEPEGEPTSLSIAVTLPTDSNNDDEDSDSSEDSEGDTSCFIRTLENGSFFWAYIKILLVLMGIRSLLCWKKER